MACFHSGQFGAQGWPHEVRNQTFSQSWEDVKGLMFKVREASWQRGLTRILSFMAIRVRVHKDDRNQRLRLEANTLRCIPRQIKTR